KVAGIDRNTQQPVEPEGWIAHDAGGDPTGHLIAGAGDMARKAWWKDLGQPIKKWDFMHFDQATYVDAILAQQSIYHACGVVGIREMGASIDELDAFIQTHRNGSLKLRS